MKIAPVILAVLIVAVAGAAYAVGSGVSYTATAAPGFADAADASPQARAVMNRWMTADEGCQGGHVTADSAICRKRDALGEQAEKLGWCWAYSDWRVTNADYRWHRCEISAPKGFVPDPTFDDSGAGTPSQATTVTLPAYDTADYCRTVGDAVGGSFSVEKGGLSPCIM